MTYSITLNFFIPEKIISKVKNEELSEDFIFDWRKKGLFHCTVKALELSRAMPSKEYLDSLIIKASRILSKQKSFEVVIKDIDKFPDVLYARVNSHELKELHKKLCNEKLPSIRPDFEGENYIPHASLVSLAGSSSTKLNISKTFGKFRVREIQLVIWDVSNGQKPSIYHRFKLKN